MRLCFLQRTVPDTKQYFAPIEEVIRHKFIPALIGRKVTDLERRMLALPVRLGGIGIQNPVLTAEREFHTSVTVTRSLTTLIENQERDLSRYDSSEIKEIMSKLKTEKEECLIEELAQILSQMTDEKMKRNLELAGEKGAGAWLTALPLEAMGYTLNKQEFRDAIYLRYSWRIPNTPSFCGCGKKNSVDHTLNCKLGGYVTMRHNNIRDFEAHLLKEVCKDVRIEPELMPTGNVETGSGSNKAEKARLDVSAVGVWSSMERTFLDVRVMHPNSPSYSDKSVEQIYAQHEREKKSKYNSRVLQVEKGSFTPLIFSTTGGMGPECTKYHKRVAELVSRKRGETYSDVVNFIRTRIRFSLLRSILVAVRGERGKRRRIQYAEVSDLSLNIVPERSTYEA